MGFSPGQSVGGCLEANISIEGSLHSDDITDYYPSPIELGREDQIDFSRDFVGKEALEKEVDDPDRTKVSLFWDDDDVVDIHRPLFEEGDTYRKRDCYHTLLCVLSGTSLRVLSQPKIILQYRARRTG